MSKRTQFLDDGYLVAKAFFSPDEIGEIIQQVNRYITELVPQLPGEHVYYEDKSDPSTLKQLQRMHEHDPWFEALFDGKPRQLAEELLASEVTRQNMQFFNKPPGVGQPTPPHQDGYYFKLEPPEALTMWLALEEVDEENGCVRYVRGSHLLGMRPHGLSGTLGFSQGMTDFGTEADFAAEVTMPAQPGDLLAHHALTIHRAEGNRSTTRMRRALGFIFYSVNAQVNEQAQAEYRAQADATQQGKV